MLFRSRMSRYGILGRYLPEFGQIIGKMQHDLFHIYTVDAHTLQVIENMRRFRWPEAKTNFPVAAHIVHNLPKLEPLYIAELYHDIAKRSKHAKDHGHAFRSAVAAARSLPLIGVDLPESYHSGIDGWSELTLAAIGDGTTDGNHVDNRTLPHILEQLDAMLAQDSASSRIVKIILFHHSITTVTDWPQPNPLSDTEILQYFDSELLHLMRIMLLADSDGWELFHASTCHAYRLETRGVFDRLRQAIAP